MWFLISLIICYMVWSIILFLNHYHENSKSKIIWNLITLYTPPANSPRRYEKKISFHLCFNTFSTVWSIGAALVKVRFQECRRMPVTKIISISHSFRCCFQQNVSPHFEPPQKKTVHEKHMLLIDPGTRMQWLYLLFHDLLENCGTFH
jgi:surface polysaccharide O-acyltransferase-like enzyme